MVIRIELVILTKLTDKKENGEILKATVCQTAPHWQSCRLGGSYLFMKYDVFRQMPIFFNGMEYIRSLNNCLYISSCIGRTIYQEYWHIHVCVSTCIYNHIIL